MRSIKLNNLMNELNVVIKNRYWLNIANDFNVSIIDDDKRKKDMVQIDTKFNDDYDNAMMCLALIYTC
ncbi:hypothetical protein DERP_004317 [Dermatophagoides pteronyssinus]|uniref:Uncharacterized protein n=1 Tax=Dermatophagoides pteronyssinus TaxID=6956 RepID=A0ABQ8JP42_DERPT|nr:hypothetical protein DERP_004317 [Dermatophagoides pteronyssinus]